MPFIAMALGIVLVVVLLVGAMLLPYLPGGYDPLASGLAQSATVAAFAGLLLVPLGAAWLISGRGYSLAKSALLAAILVAAVAAIAMTATGSAIAGAVMAVTSVTAVVHLWRTVSAARISGTKISKAVPVGLMLVPLAAPYRALAPVEGR